MGRFGFAEGADFFFQGAKGLGLLDLEGGDAGEGFLVGAFHLGELLVEGDELIDAGRGRWIGRGLRLRFPWPDAGLAFGSLQLAPGFRRNRIFPTPVCVEHTR